MGIIKCQWPSISGQEWIFTLPGPPPRPQMNKIYKTMVILKTMSIRQWRTVIPGRQEANRVSPLTSQVHCLQRISRPWCREDKYRQGPVNSLSCGDRDESLARVHRTDRVSERVTPREVQRVYRGSPSHIQQRTGQQCGMPVRKLH